jgi:cytolysin (calcineurin-like family phosphatase)
MKSGKYAGNNFVYTNQEYIPKVTSSEPTIPSIAKSMSEPNVDSAADIAKTVSDMSKAAEYKPEPPVDNKTGMIKIGDIMATQKEIDTAKSINPNVSDFPTTDADLAKDIKAGRRLQGSSWTKPTAQYK